MRHPRPTQRLRQRACRSNGGFTTAPAFSLLPAYCSCCSPAGIPPRAPTLTSSGRDLARIESEPILRESAHNGSFVDISPWSGTQRDKSRPQFGLHFLNNFNQMRVAWRCAVERGFNPGEIEQLLIFHRAHRQRIVGLSKWAERRDWCQVRLPTALGKPSTTQNGRTVR